MKKKLIFLLLLNALTVFSCSQYRLSNKEPETEEDYKYYGEKFVGVVEAVKLCHEFEDGFNELLGYQSHLCKDLLLR